MDATTPEDSTNASGAVMAYVLFYDIVGSSKLTSDEGLKISERLQALVRNTKQFREASVRGDLVVLPTGDGAALVFLNNIEEPVLCAVEVAKALKKDPFCALRMGVHNGPVFLVEDINGHRNVSGAGINRAERIMSSGDAGHLMLSASTAEAVRQFSQWRDRIHDIGLCTTKDGPLPIFSLHDADIGNSQLPQKSMIVMAQRRAQRMRNVALAGVLALAVSIGVFLYWRSEPEPRVAIRYSMIVQPVNGAERPIPREMVFPAGYRVKLRVAGAKALSMYIVNEGPANAGVATWTWLYPDQAAGQELQPNQPVLVPRDVFFVLDGMQGKELVYLICAEAPIATLDKIRAAMLARKSDGRMEPEEVAAVREIISREMAATKTVNGEEATDVRTGSPILVKKIVLEHM